MLCRGGRARGADGRAYERVHGRASDPLHAVDASNNCRHKASELSVWRAVFGKGAIETNKRKREKRKKRHEAERTRMAVVYNCFAHLESIALEVMNCYAEEAPDRFPTSACLRVVVSRGLSTPSTR